MGTAPDREEVVAMLAALGNRAPEQVRERIDSLEQVWLVHQVEQRYGVSLELSDDELGRLGTVSGALEVLRRAVSGAAPEPADGRGA